MKKYNWKWFFNFLYWLLVIVLTAVLAKNYLNLSLLASVDLFITNIDLCVNIKPHTHKLWIILVLAFALGLSRVSFFLRPVCSVLDLRPIFQILWFCFSIQTRDFPPWSSLTAGRAPTSVETILVILCCLFTATHEHWRLFSEYTLLLSWWRVTLVMQMRILSCFYELLKISKPIAGYLEKQT